MEKITCPPKIRGKSLQKRPRKVLTYVQQVPVVSVAATQPAPAQKAPRSTECRLAAKALTEILVEISKYAVKIFRTNEELRFSLNVKARNDIDRGAPLDEASQTYFRNRDASLNHMGTLRLILAQVCEVIPVLIVQCFETDEIGQANDVAMSKILDAKRRNFEELVDAFDRQTVPRVRSLFEEARERYPEVPAIDERTLADFEETAKTVELETDQKMGTVLEKTKLVSLLIKSCTEHMQNDPFVSYATLQSLDLQILISRRAPEPPEPPTPILDEAVAESVGASLHATGVLVESESPRSIPEFVQTVVVNTEIIEAVSERLPKTPETQQKIAMMQAKTRELEELVETKPLVPVVEKITEVSETQSEAVAAIRPPEPADVILTADPVAVEIAKEPIPVAPSPVPIEEARLFGEESEQIKRLQAEEAEKKRKAEEEANERREMERRLQAEEAEKKRKAEEEAAGKKQKAEDLRLRLETVMGTTPEQQSRSLEEQAKIDAMEQAVETSRAKLKLLKMFEAAPEKPSEEYDVEPELQILETGASEERELRRLEKEVAEIQEEESAGLQKVEAEIKREEETEKEEYRRPEEKLAEQERRQQAAKKKKIERQLEAHRRVEERVAAALNRTSRPAPSATGTHSVTGMPGARSKAQRTDKERKVVEARVQAHAVINLNDGAAIVEEIITMQKNDRTSLYKISWKEFEGRAGAFRKYSREIFAGLHAEELSQGGQVQPMRITQLVRSYKEAKREVDEREAGTKHDPQAVVTAMRGFAGVLVECFKDMSGGRKGTEEDAEKRHPGIWRLRLEMKPR